MSRFSRPRLVDEPPRLQACPDCSYALCICKVLAKHSATCTWRSCVLDTHPVACVAHEVVACVDCHKCDCGGKAA